MKRPTVYIVDDEPEIGRLLALVLKEDDYVVEVFHSAEAFRKTIDRSIAPHLLIVDKNLPGQSGLELVALQRRELYRFEAIMITGYADEHSEAQAAELDIFRYLRKPFVISDLQEAVVGAEKQLNGG